MASHHAMSTQKTELQQAFEAALRASLPAAIAIDFRSGLGGYRNKAVQSQWKGWCLAHSHVVALQTVMDAIHSGEWQLRRNEPWEVLTDKANEARAYSVIRARAPFCDNDGARQWHGPTAYDALREGERALRENPERRRT